MSDFDKCKTLDEVRNYILPGVWSLSNKDYGEASLEVDGNNIKLHKKNGKDVVLLGKEEIGKTSLGELCLRLQNNMKG